MEWTLTLLIVVVAFSAIASRIYRTIRGAAAPRGVDGPACGGCAGCGTADDACGSAARPPEASVRRLSIGADLAVGPRRDGGAG